MGAKKNVRYFSRLSKSIWKFVSSCLGQGAHLDIHLDIYLGDPPPARDKLETRSRQIPFGPQSPVWKTRLEIPKIPFGRPFGRL